MTYVPGGGGSGGNIATLGDVALNNPINNQSLTFDSATSKWTNAAVTGGGVTNLSVARSATTVTVASDSGTDATLVAADATDAGVMSAADKVKLDGIAAGAQVNTVTSVATKTGAVTLVKADVGLGNVDNTADADKPVSTSTQQALDTLDGNLANGLATKADRTLAVGIQTWNGTGGVGSWSARPSGYLYVEAFSDGTAGSSRDPDAPQPTGSQNGDRWWDAIA